MPEIAGFFYWLNMLSKKAILEFQEIYQREYGKKLADAEAVALAANLINLMRVAYRPMPKDNGKNKQP